MKTTTNYRRSAVTVEQARERRAAALRSWGLRLFTAAVIAVQVVGFVYLHVRH